MGFVCPLWVCESVPSGPFPAPGWLYPQPTSPHSKHSPTPLSKHPHKHSRAIHFSNSQLHILNPPKL